LPEDPSPENVNNWRSPLLYNTTLLLVAASLTLSTIISRLPKGKEKVAQIMTPKNKVAQVPDPEESISQVIAPEDRVAQVPDRIVEVLPEQEDITQLSKKTNEAMSRYTTAALWRYITKSRTAVSTRKINHDEASSSLTSPQKEFEITNATPEELDL
jgi:hypothetical protein